MSTLRRSRSSKTSRRQVKKAAVRAEPEAAQAVSFETTTVLPRDGDPDVMPVLPRRAEPAEHALQQELHLALRRDAGRNVEEARAMCSRPWLSSLADKGRRRLG